MTEAVDATIENVANARGVPAVGMHFENEYEAYELYDSYAEGIGFSIRKTKLQMTSKNVVTRRRFVCSGEGFRRKKKGEEARKPRPETRSGCPACMTIKITPSCRYRVTEFVPNHNHQLANPSKIHMLKMKKAQSKARAAKAELADSVITKEFDTEDEAYEFYNMYAGNIGFSVRKSTLKKSSENVVMRRMFVCSKEGFCEKKKRAMEVRNPRPSTRTGCPACLTIKITPSGRYRVTDFVTYHNHPLTIPSTTHESRLQCVEDDAETNKADSTDDSVMIQKSSNGFVGRKTGECQIDSKSYVRSKRMEAMQMGDAGAVLEYLQKMQVDNPSFFYAIQVDEDDNISNFFWTDTKSVMDYKYFGDVVCFDTTYKANGYGRPFAPFFGVNHHKQTVIFGAALLYDETVESFKWLFETFKIAMCGKQPKTILTDRCVAMSDAIAAAWPGTTHRLCVWHMYQNAVKHLNKVFQGSKTFAFDFSECLFDYEEEDEFLSAWKTMLEKYDLKDNQWLSKLFEDREKWALAYGRETFCADMKSTQRNESLSYDLKKYLSPEVDLLQFFEHYERVLQERRCEELQADIIATQSNMRSPYLRMLRHASNAYTPAAFKMFQKEFELYIDCMIYSCGEALATSEYKVTAYEKPKEYLVRFDSTDGTVVCSCKKFEFSGIQCCHVLKVLDSRNTKELPPQYILKRWRKDAKAGIVSDSSGFLTDGDPESSLAKRYNYLCRNFTIIAARAAKTMESYTFIESQIDLLMGQLEQIL